MSSFCNFSDILGGIFPIHFVTAIVITCLVFDKRGIESEIFWHLMEIEKRLLKKGILPMEYAGVLFLEIIVSWRQNKQGKGRSQQEKKLPLNKLTVFKENGYSIVTVDAVDGSWARLGPLWEAFHKMGLCHQVLGRSCLIIVMYNG